MKNSVLNLFVHFDAIVFFDTETSGLDTAREQIIELAAVCIDKNGMIDEMDEFVKMPEGKRLDPKIIELTHITDEMLEKYGISPTDAARRFHSLIEGKGRRSVLLIAHNAQFDLEFTRLFLKGHKFNTALKFLDTVTVYKDRAPYPHRLETAITHYGLEDKVQNSHRAIDDVKALVEVTRAMNEERPDLQDYVNLFGYNEKYGAPKIKIAGVTYKPQSYTNSIRPEKYTLPKA